MPGANLGPPEQVAELVDGDQPITREAVAALRKSRLKTRPAGRQPRPSPKRSAPAAKLLGRARLLSRQLDALLLRLSQADTAALFSDTNDERPWRLQYLSVGPEWLLDQISIHCARSEDCSKMGVISLVVARW